MTFQQYVREVRGLPPADLVEFFQTANLPEPKADEVRTPRPRPVVFQVEEMYR